MKTPEEWIEYCEKNKDWIKNYSKDKEVKKIFEELGIPKWFDEPIKDKNATIHHLPLDKKNGNRSSKSKKKKNKRL